MESDEVVTIYIDPPRRYAVSDRHCVCTHSQAFRIERLGHERTAVNEKQIALSGTAGMRVRGKAPAADFPHPALSGGLDPSRDRSR